MNALTHFLSVILGACHCFPLVVELLEWSLNFVFFPLQLVVREPSEPSHKFEWGSHYVLIGDYMKAKECFHDAVSIQQAHQPRL